MIEELYLHIIIYIIILLIFFLIIFSLKNKRSETILKILYLFQQIKTKYKKKRGRQNFIDKIYKRDSSDKITSVLAGIFLIFIAFIIITHCVNFILVTSESMSPTLHRGDLVLVQSIFKTPEKGDIIQFEIQGKRLPVFHRVHEVTPTVYITKGDAATNSDYWKVHDDQLQAKAVNIFNKPVIIAGVGEMFIVEPKTGKYGSEFHFITGLLNIFKILALIIFILALLSLIDT